MIRAGILVTGTEVLSGRIADRNGPWVSERLAELGVEVAEITVVGDRPEDLEGALRLMGDEGMDLIVTSGGLGPTADDLTAEVVGRFAGRELVLDDGMEEKIAEILERLRAALPLRPRGRAGGEPQAGDGARGRDGARSGGNGAGAGRSGGRAGGDRPARPAARASADVGGGAGDRASARAARAGRRRCAATRCGCSGCRSPRSPRACGRWRRAGWSWTQVEITTCLRRGEIEIDVRYRDHALAVAEAVRDGLRERHREETFSLDGETIDAQVATLLLGHQLGLAESCSGGLLAARITDLEGASEYMAGGVVAYSNEAKADLLGVDPELIEAKGAVSPEVAEAMAIGALERFGADVAVSITGIAGPGGGSEEKPVGYVCFNARLADGTSIARDPVIPGGRLDIRERSALVGMHLLRMLLGEKEGTKS